VLDVAEYLEFLAQDERTRVAALFIETIRDPRRFAVAAAKMHAAGKPIVTLKVGQSQKGAAAAVAHTGSLAGSEAVYQDYFERYGVIAVDDLDELVESVALMLSVRQYPQGRGIGVINVSGGEIALTCDVAQRIGLDLPELSQATTDRIQAALPDFGTARNPLDATGTAVFDMAMYRACIEGLASDPSIGLVAVSQDCPLNLGTQQAATYRTMAATAASASTTIDKPLVFYSNVAAGVHPAVAEPLVDAGVPVLQGARASLLAIRRLCDYSARRTVEAAPTECIGPRNPGWTERFQLGGAFTEREAKLFLADHGVPVTREHLATTAEEALAAAESLSYPVVLKVESTEIPHKSDVGGVRVNLQTAEEVAQAYDTILAAVRSHRPEIDIAGVLVQEMVTGGTEVIVGLSRQEPFGMALVVGTGGVLVELVRDSALALTPIDQHRAERLIQETRVGQFLRGYRGARPGDVEALRDLLVRLSDLALAYGDWIEGLDLNPVIVGESGQGVRVVDALLVPRPSGKSD
jgi:acetate---CoA ligase (ADP-forming)